MEPSEARELQQLPRREHEAQALGGGPVTRQGDAAECSSKEV
jgi:hypothetical protein